MGQVTISGSNYDVYGLLTNDPPSPPDPPAPCPGADSYMAGSFTKSATWLTLAPTTTLRNQLLVDATRALDRLPWAGTKTVAAQALAWPRTGVTRLDGSAVSSTVYPLEVVKATYELAYLILTDADLATELTSTTNGNIKQVKAGRAEVQFFRPQEQLPLPAPVWDLISMFLQGGSSVTGVGLSIASGTSTDSSFDCDTDFYRTGSVV